MFETVSETPLFGANLVAALFREDKRADKIDLGLGVYRDDAGETPIMAAVKEMEARLVESQRSKSYQGLIGDPGFSDLMLDLVLGEGADKSRISVLQTPGGVAALSLSFHLIKSVRPDATVWLSDPSWANHLPIIDHTGLNARHFPYHDPATAAVDFDAMSACLSAAPAGDVVLLQAVCHNPSGADLTSSQWDRVFQICRDRELLPVIDMAYQGFGEGLEEDAYGPRACLAALPEMILTATCSKTFSVYRDRAAIAAVVSKTADNAGRTMSLMRRISNVTYAMPADHAAAVVKGILSDPDLRKNWIDELNGMRRRVGRVRTALVEALKRSTNRRAFDYLGQQQGMFSLLPLRDDQVDALRERHAIYLVKGGRMNVAGLRMSEIDRFAEALADVLQVEG